MIRKEKYDYIVVGSGAGGGTLTRELANRGKDVLCIEWGSPLPSVGNMMDCRYFYDFKRLPDFMPKPLRKIPLVPPKTLEGSIMWRAIGAGGTSVISLGNGARCMESDLMSMGVDLTEAFEETEREVGLKQVGERLLSKGSRTIREAANKLGYNFIAMPKYIDQKKCVKCHKCLYGCQYEAKWDTRRWLNEALEKGAEFLYETKVEQITRSNGRATGVIANSPNGRLTIKGNTVILAAGGMATPVILQKSDIKAGDGFFLDFFWNTYGITNEKGLNQDREVNMALVDLEWSTDEGFLLSPYMNHDRMTRLQEMNPLRAMKSSKNMIGMMIKITDEANGKVFVNGKCSKPLTERDWNRLKKGAKIAREVLTEAGAHPDSLFESKIQGAHPGGGASIGSVVDTDLQTNVDNLFVCDASVIPGKEFNNTDRLPPILTIVAFAKRLAKTIA
jgi:choline dehydrogenase-like flavoprotein